MATLREFISVHEGPEAWIENEYDHRRRSCLGRCASCCPVRDAVCSVVREVWIFAALFCFHGSRPDRRFGAWQGASLALESVLSEFFDHNGAKLAKATPQARRASLSPSCL